MADDVTKIKTGDRSVLMNAVSGGNISLQEMLAAIQELEQQKPTDGGLGDRSGEWLLLWTAGTKKYREFSQTVANVTKLPLSSRNKVIQRIDGIQQWIENEVYFAFGSLCVAGTFEYGEQKRLQFTFKQVRLKLGNFPTIQLPLGNWAQGWLQTTYLDENLHIERGDRGGVSVYVRNLPVRN